MIKSAEYCGSSLLRLVFSDPTKKQTHRRRLVFFPHVRNTDGARSGSHHHGPPNTPSNPGDSRARRRNYFPAPYIFLRQQRSRGRHEVFHVRCRQAIPPSGGCPIFLFAGVAAVHNASNPCAVGAIYDRLIRDVGRARSAAVSTKG